MKYPKIFGISFFRHQSSECVTTFADSEYTIPNTHPVLADAEGVFPPIFLLPEDADQSKLDCVIYDKWGEILVKFSPISFQPNQPWWRVLQ